MRHEELLNELTNLKVALDVIDALLMQISEVG